ncbi:MULTISPECIES: hypothetical protein [unclassified Sphingomonas]|jgi:hypothetical protein|nr:MULTISPECIES: hypothetical protein [unclassified Sphingomonas]
MILENFRLLTSEEIDLVSGGLRSEEIVYYYDEKTGELWKERYDSQSGNWLGETLISGGDNPTNYWEIGFSLGIGFGLYGTDQGMGISWNGGIGIYGQIGTADNAGEAAAAVGQDHVVIGIDTPSVPTHLEIDPDGRVKIPALGGGIGIYATDSDPMSRYHK